MVVLAMSNSELAEFAMAAWLVLMAVCVIANLISCYKLYKMDEEAKESVAKEIEKAQRIEKIAYIRKHQESIKAVYRQYFANIKEVCTPRQLSKLAERIQNHDVDKIIMLREDNFSIEEVSVVHRHLAPHHDNGRQKDFVDYVEMILDWECARFTKPDKPLNARETLYKYYPHLIPEVDCIIDLIIK